MSADPTPDRDVFTITETAARLGVSREFVSRELVATRRLPSVQLGRGRRYVTRKALDAFLADLEAADDPRAADGSDQGAALAVGHVERFRELEARLDRLEARLAQGEAS